MAKIASASAPKLHHFTPQGLANLCVGLRGLGALDATLASGVASELSKRIGDLAVEQPSARDYVGVLGALAPFAAESSATSSAAPSATDTQQFRALFARAAGALSAPGGLVGFRPQQLAGLAQAYAAAGMRHDGLLEAVVGATLASQGRAQPWVLPEVAAASKALGYSSVQLQAAVAGSGAGLKQTAKVTA